VIAANNINNSGTINSISVTAGDKIINRGSINGGTDNLSDPASLIYGLTFHAKSLEILGGKIFTPGTLDIGQRNQHTTIILGSGPAAVWAGTNFGVPRLKSDGSLPGNSLGVTEVYYEISPGSGGLWTGNVSSGSFGNVLGSETGKFYINPDNLKDIQSNPLNRGYKMTPIPTSQFDWSPASGLNVFVNGFQSDQVGNLVNGLVSIVAKPAQLPLAPPDPCGKGSTLELKNTNGVMPEFEDLLPFSVLPEEDNVNHDDKARPLGSAHSTTKQSDNNS
jgi:hypothetical protein